jgi:hypothetical protein
MTPTGPQSPAVAREPASPSAATYDSKLTATAWHRRLFREPTVVWRYVDNDDDDGGFE